MEEKKPITLEELRNRFGPVRNFSHLYKKKLSTLNKIAVWITDHVGSMGFFLIIFMWTVSWLGWNTLAPKDLRFDPFPAFVLWLFLSNMIQIFLMPLLMIGQNMQATRADARAENDLNINIKSEAEIESILMNLENQNKLILQILDELKKTKT